MSRLLGIDLGERRIGIAVADPDGRARALQTLRRARTVTADAEALRRIIDEQDASELIVGLPLEAGGHEGPQVAITRTWVDAVTPLLTGVAIRFRDERLSSHVAEGRVGPMKRGRSGGPPSATQRAAHRARIDREAAAIILQDELDARARVEQP
ncbi:MAG TPA: Holliday junction resolvase RuvX [Candidatus Limnocylindrales bacterium]|jgi:putative Holliday junction resolvase